MTNPTLAPHEALRTVPDSLLNIICNHEARATAGEVRSMAAELQSLRAQAAERAVPWENFPSYLIDHCEGDTITEEGLQHALAAMLANSQYTTPVPQAERVVPAASRLLQLADELEEQLTSGATWSPAQHACCNVATALRDLAAAPAQPVPEPADPDGEAFRTAARLGLTLRFYGGCAQSSMPGTPSAYEVVAGTDRAAAMRDAIQRADAVIASGGEALRVAPLPAPAQQVSNMTGPAGDGARV